MKKLDVLYTVNDKYLDICLASILSLIKNGNIQNLKIHIITSNFDREDYQKLDSILSKYNCEYYLYDIKMFDIERFQIPSWRGTQIANARLFFQEFIGSNLSNIENLLYLDSDLIVVSDLTGLENYKDNAVCALKDGCFKAYLEKMGGLSNYFNSGVLLFNTEIWTKNNYQDKIVEFLEHPKVEITFPDQDVFNCALDGEVAEMPLNYNLSANAYLFGPLGQKLYFRDVLNYNNSEVIEAKKNPKILHSTGILSIKPWTENSINPFNELFMKYILEVNPEFQKVEISKLKKVLSSYPTLFKMMVLAKSFMPEEVRDMVRKLAL